MSRFSQENSDLGNLGDFWGDGADFQRGLTEEMPENVHFCTLNPAIYCPLSQLKPSWL